MEPMVEVLVEEPKTVVEEQSAATLSAETEESAEELVEMLLAEITIDGMCGVY
uniref:Mycofactocin n=1 Tax=Thermomicrobium roseum TaxID=500 RepID=A0A7C5RTR0_THERO